MTAPIRIVSSMATRQVLAELVGEIGARSERAIDLESVGGVDAAKRVRAGEAFDAVVLASDVIEQLIGEGRILPGSRVDLVRSGIALAVRAGAPRPDIASEESLRRAVLASASVGYSTGPSGTHVARLLERWGVSGAGAPRIVQAPAGVPVGAMVAQGQVDLGFQQLAELMHLPGIVVLGPLPPAIQLVTTFSGGIAATSTRPDDVRALLATLASPDAAAAKARHGMEPA